MAAEEGEPAAPRLDGGVDGSLEMPVDLLEQIQGDWLDEDGAEISVYGDDVAGESPRQKQSAVAFVLCVISLLMDCWWCSHTRAGPRARGHALEHRGRGEGRRRDG